MNRSREQPEAAFPNPHQPLFTDENGTTRFKANRIVRYLLDAGGIDLNQIAILPFSDDDRRQFCQLIGTSECGYFDWGFDHPGEDDPKTDGPKPALDQAGEWKQTIDKLYDPDPQVSLNAINRCLEILWSETR